MKIIWSPRAQRDLARIVDRIVRDKKGAALQWVRAVYKKVSRLQRFPQSGRIVPEVGRTDLREILVGRYRVIYKVGPSLSILTIFHGAKELKKMD